MPEVHFPRTNALKLFEKPLVAPNEALLASETKRRSPALASTGEFGKDWRAREVRATALIKLLEYQGEEVEYVALSPPPENLEGGMEVNVIYREILTDLLRRQLEASLTKESRGFWRGLLGR